MYDTYHFDTPEEQAFYHALLGATHSPYQIVVTESSESLIINSKKPLKKDCLDCSTPSNRFLLYDTQDEKFKLTLLLNNKYVANCADYTDEFLNMNTQCQMVNMPVLSFHDTANITPQELEMILLKPLTFS